MKTLTVLFVLKHKADPLVLIELDCGELLSQFMLISEVVRQLHFKDRLSHRVKQFEVDNLREPAVLTKVCMHDLRVFK